jgi:hypothetical protein
MFGSHKRIARFAKYIAKRVPKGPVEIGIGHAICEDDALEFERLLIGVHGGPRTLLVSFRPYFSAQDVARSAD